MNREFYEAAKSTFIEGHLQNLGGDAPAVFNGMVKYRKYRVTVEPVDEPDEVLAARLRLLYRDNDNHHNWAALHAEANKLGIKL